MSRITGEITLTPDHGEARTVPVNHHRAYYTAVLDALEISAQKNADYASGDDPLGNFRSVQDFSIPPETGLLCRMVDKWSRIRTWFSRGDLAVRDETVTDALSDLGNYCFLMIALLEQARSDQELADYIRGLRLDEKSLDD